MSNNALIYKQILIGCLISFSALSWAKETSDNAQTNNLHHNSSSGPNLRSSTPMLNTFHEVEVGQICGKKNKEGIQLICRSHANCVLTVEGDHGMCVASPSLNQSQ